MLERVIIVLIVLLMGFIALSPVFIEIYIKMRSWYKAREETKNEL